jgi:nucleotide-binding universal stress UspA family protein
MFKKILVAVDKSDITEYVFESSISLAKVLNAKVMLLHVLSPLDEGYPTPVYPGPDSMYPSMHEEAIRSYAKQWENFEREGVNLLKSLADRATAAGIVTDFNQNAGDPGRTICDIARTWNADLIVVGRRGRSGLSEMILGSVSNYVLHHAPCSVLTVQGPLSAETPVKASETVGTA